MFVSPQNLYVEAYSPVGGYLEAGPLGGDELMRVESSPMGLVLFQEAPGSSLAPLLFYYMRTKDKQEEGSRWTPSLSVP